MCGIAGHSGRVGPVALERAMRLIMHRGPDGHGTFVDSANSIGLGHTRLSIIDLTSAGDQPMHDARGDVVLVYNGEIYNHRELRRGLAAQGFSFTGTSDTEVLLTLYLRDGAAMLPKLNGIFAFAIWDARSHELFVARDAIGVKPLYYAQHAGTFAFASEIKSLLQLLPGLRELDHAALERYLTFLWCPGSATLLKGVTKLQPGEALTIREGRITRRWSWYQLPVMRGMVTDLSLEEAVGGAEAHLRRAVHRQMVADVPVGAFLSGGLDSSAVVAFAREINPDLLCFTIDASGARESGATDDLPYAIRVAQHLGVRLKVVQVTASRMAEDLMRMVAQLDEPLADFSALNVNYICQLARDHGIKVLLSGGGGDDLFTGYRRHRAIRLEELWNRCPRPVRMAAARVASHLDARVSTFRRLQRALTGAELIGDHHLIEYFRWSRTRVVRSLLVPRVAADLPIHSDEEPMMDFLAAMPRSANSLQRMLALEQRFFLADHNLMYTDKMSMAAGVETRVPFLDSDLIEFAARIPVELNQGYGEGKRVLKRALERYLPHDIVHRPKNGFGVPLRRWMQHELREFMDAHLSEENLRRRGLFDANRVRQLIADNSAGRLDASYTLFSVLCVELWCKSYLDRIDDPAALSCAPVVLQPNAARSPSAASSRRVCTNCVMDTSDAKITFDEHGVCDHCHGFYSKILPNWPKGEAAQPMLTKMINSIRAAGSGREFDCIIGMSGGIDSSYLTYVAKEQLGLRPLVFHVDAGWNSQEAVNNIEKLVERLGLDLYTEVIDWEEMRDLQLAFFKAGVPHIHAPQDHAFFATMYKFAARHDVKYILTGANLSTECIRNPVEWMYYQSNSIQLRAIHREHGNRPLRNYPTTSILRHKAYLTYIKGIKVVRPLNYIPYNKVEAMSLLEQKFGWQRYPQKHFDSRFTRFYEGFWLPTRFGYDTRKVQFSSLILTGQMTREEALEEIRKPSIDPESIPQEMAFVAAKLRISVDELESYLYTAKRTYRDYASQERLFMFGARVMKRLGLEIGGKR